MLFKENGNEELPTIILLHGGGLSDWALSYVVELMKNDYHIVTPVIEGHGENGDETFISIEDSAEKLIKHIDEKYDGEVFALGGLSLGAQIIIEVLARRADITQFAIIESALVIPIKGTTALTIPTYKLFYGLVKKRWFAKMQAQTLCVPETMFEQYFRDSLRMSKESLINITLSNGNYNLKNSIAKTTAKVLIIVGEKEIKLMQKSAQILKSKIPNSELLISKQMKHGELSIVNPQKFVEIIKNHLR